MPDGISATVSQIVEQTLKTKKGLETGDYAKIAATIAKGFKVSVGEVAILELAPGGKHLNFLVPEKLAKVGSIPMTGTSALAVRTVRDRRPEMINNFPSAKHPTVFEGIRVGDKGAEPIQKILSVPVLLEGKAVGVIQVSRKGKTPGAAGADFTPKNLQELVQTAAVLSKCFKKA
ncbi:MAG: GAF domain-containing protein [Terriglobia bacterium]